MTVAYANQDDSCRHTRVLVAFARAGARPSCTGSRGILLLHHVVVMSLLLQPRRPATIETCIHAGALQQQQQLAVSFTRVASEQKMHRRAPFVRRRRRRCLVVTAPQIFNQTSVNDMPML